MNRNDVISNLKAAFTGQTISLLLGFILSFVMPKILDVVDFSFWQLFLFYATYVGFFHFGINDGVYLKYGGLDFSQMKRQYVTGQFNFLFITQIIVFILILSLSLTLCKDLNRKIVWVCSGVYMIVFNLSSYLGNVFQAANLTKWYSYSIILEKLVLLIGLFVFFCFDEKHFYIYVTLYIIAKFVCLLYTILKGKYFVFNRIHDYKEVFQEIKDTICCGIKLTLSSVASMLILGIGRLYIDLNWSIVIFGKISLALTLTFFILGFLQQVSMVFFPVLRRINQNSKVRIFYVFYGTCFFIIPLIYIVIFPIKEIIGMWLSNYMESMKFWLILLPITLYDAKMNMIFNTYFKVLRMESSLFIINLCVLILSVIIGGIGAYLLHSYSWIVYGMVLTIYLRSTISELVIEHRLDVRTKKLVFWETIYTSVYILCVVISPNIWYSVATMTVMYVCQLILFKSFSLSVRKDIYYFMKKKIN